MKSINLTKLKADFRAAALARGVDPLTGRPFSKHWQNVRVMVPPQRERRADMQSKITVSNDIRKFGEFGVPIGCLRTRKTEVQALGTCDAPRLDALHRRVLYLEQVGSQPSRHTDYRNRPVRPIHGVALWSWIGVEARVPPSRVRDMLDYASAVISLAERA